MVHLWSTAHAAHRWRNRARFGTLKGEDPERDYRPFVDALLVASARSHSPEPQLADLLGQLLRANTENQDPLDPKIATASIHVASLWIANPQQIRRGKFTFETAMSFAADARRSLDEYDELLTAGHERGDQRGGGG